ncbi:hypothetical protein JKY72_04420 [Candidatus Gracilibacteria bacterium]|nr:hypothetical protein [Candidatus Gracilibacteria bacterium]
MHRRQRRYNRSVRSERSGGYLGPFLIIILLGVIFVLLLNFWQAIFGVDTRQGAFMHIVDGSVEMKTWGTDEFFDLNADALLIQGDEILTSANGQLIVEFMDGTLMRVGAGSDVVLQEIDLESDNPSLSVLLVDGSLWFNKIYKDTGSTKIIVKMSNSELISTGSTIFALENEFDESVRVLHGDDVRVDVFAEDVEKVVESEDLGIGQEIVLTDKVLERFWANQSPTVVNGISDEFNESSWFEWNNVEDETPTEFEKTGFFASNDFEKVDPEELVEVIEPSEDEVVVDAEVVDGEVEVSEIEAPVEEEAVVEDAVPTLPPLSTPVISEVGGSTETRAGVYVVPGRLASLKGTVAGASKVVVNGYTLSKFTAGDTTWAYFANADFSLMHRGDNTYEIYSVDASGKKSASLFVKVLHEPVPVVAEPAPVEAEVAEFAEDAIVVDVAPALEQ